MKIDMELKPGDVVLLKLLACVVILFFMGRFLIFPGIEKHQDLAAKKDEVTVQKQEMQYTMDSRDVTEKKIATQKENLKKSKEGFYEVMENQDVDTLVTGLALKHNLLPVYLNIEDPVAGIPSAYQSTKTTEDDAQQSGSIYVQYVNTTTVTITLQGSESEIRELLDDIAKNYPGIQVRSFDMEAQTYVDSELQSTEQMNCNCVLAVYTCGELSNTKGE